MVYKFFDKKSSGAAAIRAENSAVKSEIRLNLQLVEELHKPIIRNFEKTRSTIIF